MTAIRLYVAPAAAGKTEYLIDTVRQVSRTLQVSPRVCVASSLQVQSWRQRLAQAGGTIGVQVLTFDSLVDQCLAATRTVYTVLDDPVEFRLLRKVVDETALGYYAPLKTRPGFFQVLRRLIAELKAAQISAGIFHRAVMTAGGAARLEELARLYEGYQERLRSARWADRAGLTWLAAEIMQQESVRLAASWPLLIFDGFDNFTTVQLSLLKVLAHHADETIITLTGSLQPRAAHQRFSRTRQLLETSLRVTAEPLPAPGRSRPRRPVIFDQLEALLFENQPSISNSTTAVTLVAAPDRSAEARTALRWLKQRIVRDGLPPHQTALLARSLEPYRPFIRQIAKEFGLPIRLLNGLPLKRNPAIAALLNLVRLAQPGEDGTPILPRRLVIEAWRSPYFNWAGASVNIAPGDADLLDAVARFGRVIEGIDQWREALTTLGQATSHEADSETPISNILAGDRAHQLLDKFESFVQRIEAPAGNQSYRHFVGWLEGLIVLLLSDTPLEHSNALQVAVNNPEDYPALSTFKDVLRGLVWAEDMLGQSETVDFARFFQELKSAVEAASYRPMGPGIDRILVADVVQARGVPFEAVAVLGLAEGEFPATLTGDPFLRESDRQKLNRIAHFSLESSIQSAEREFFYETITRAGQRLLLTRPRLTDTGAEWQPSPFWEEIERLTGVKPVTLTSESMPPPAEAASWPELLESLTSQPDNNQAWRWVEARNPTDKAALMMASHLFTLRIQSAALSRFDGHLEGLAGVFGRRFAADQPWSASRLENYRACPFLFYVGSILTLEPKIEPSFGLEAWQLGNIYHLIFEALYSGVTDSANTEALLARLELVANEILDRAPEKQGFRATAWWQQSRQEIIEKARQSVLALAELADHYEPSYFEQRFFKDQALTITDPNSDDYFRVHGIIDRIDTRPDGALRVIDYKISGSQAFNRAALTKGNKLQLPLYALAASNALRLGTVVDGFYWHILQTRASDLSLAGFDGGPEAAFELAKQFAWEAVRGARAGQFAPSPPATGCPSFCPAANFCWHYQAGY